MSLAVFVLGIAVAAIALVATLTEKLSRKNQALTLCALAGLGFIALLGQQLLTRRLEAQGKAQEDAIESSRKQILEKISGTVVRTEGKVEDLSRLLANTAIRDVGEQLVLPDPSAQVANVLSMGKGSTALWGTYAKWVSDNRERQNTRLCLEFTVNGVRQYSPDWSLAYLITMPETEAKVREVISKGANLDQWFSEEFVDRALLNWKGVDFVLFTDSESHRVLAYASAREFAIELLLQERLDGGLSFKNVLNRHQQHPVESLAKAFQSIRPTVIHDLSVATIVKSMLDNKWSECVIDVAEEKFVVSLVNLVRAAA